MSTIVAIPAKSSTVTINSTAVHAESIEVSVKSQILEYGVTGQTADGDGNRWLECISGMNSATITLNCPFDMNATADLRLTGDDLKFKPGTTGSGTLLITLASGYSLAGSIVVEEISPSLDVMGSKPVGFKITCRLNGALTYTNS